MQAPKVQRGVHGTARWQQSSFLLGAGVSLCVAVIVNCVSHCVASAFHDVT